MHENIVVEGEPRILAARLFQPTFFQRNSVQGMIVVCHDPERIRVSVGRQKVRKMERFLSAGFQDNDLMALTCPPVWMTRIPGATSAVPSVNVSLPFSFSVPMLTGQ